MDEGLRRYILRKVADPGFSREMVQDDAFCARLIDAVFSDGPSKSNRSEECSSAKYTGMTLLKLEYEIEKKRKEAEKNGQEGEV